MSVEQYSSRELIFTEHAIYDSGIPVMMDWERGIMCEHAKVVAQSGGDVLEVGFGMGLSADAIQAFKPASHTIMETHPQILERLHKWREGKPSVKVIEGDWIKQLHCLGRYDGIFFDPDRGYDKRFVLCDYLKPNGVFSFYNDEGVVDYPGFDCRYIKVAVSPDKNIYFQGSEYFVPVIRRVA